MLKNSLKILFYFSIYISFSICVNNFEIKDTKNIDICLLTNFYEEIYVGDKGILYFDTDFSNNKDPDFIEEDNDAIEDIFNSYITSNNKKYNVTCRFWKPLNLNLKVFCKLDSNLNKGLNTATFNKVSFNYKNYYVTINPRSDIEIYQYNIPAPFLYSSPQSILLKQEVDTYKVIFKMLEYNDQIISLRGANNDTIFLDNCSKKGINLICEIQRTALEEIMFNDTYRYSFSLNSYLIGNNEGTEYIPGYVHDIFVDLSYYPKKNIYVAITKLLDTEYDWLNDIVFETNVTDISNFVSNSFELNLEKCKHAMSRFIKTIDKPLLFVVTCLVKEGTYYLGKLDSQIFLNINIKYNFYLSAINNYEAFTIKGSEFYDPYAVYPQVLDFNLKDNFELLYHMENPKICKAVRLNPDSTDLKCEDFDVFKKCIVPKSHFDKVGYYYNYHLNHANQYIIFYDLPPIKVILPFNNITMKIIKENNPNIIRIGEDKYLSFITDYYDKYNIFNKNEMIEFRNFLRIINIYNSSNFVYANCSLWKPNNDKMRIFCKLDENIGDFENKIFLNTTYIKYKNYSITIEQEESINVEVYQYSIPFLYSDKQSININNKDKVYYLIFNIKSYNNEILYISGSSNNFALLDDCKRNSSEIICAIPKQKLEEILIYNDEIFKIGAINDNIGLISFDNILDININYYDIQKEDVYIQLTKIIGGNTTEIGTPIAVETNITSFPNFISGSFGRVHYFRKMNNKPLMLFLNFTRELEGRYDMNFTKEVVLSDIHYKYNFRIQPFFVPCYLSIKNNGANILLTYPEELNFNSQDPITIRYIMTNPLYADKIKINPDSLSDLECQDLIGMKKCIVPMNHFQEKEIGLYNTYHINHKNEYSPYVESSQINVIVSIKEEININIEQSDNKNIIYIGEKGILYFVLDYNDKEKNIFNVTNLEDALSFKSSIIVDKNISNEYDVICRIWNPKDEKLNMFCKLYDYISIGQHTISLNLIQFYFRSYKFNIKSNTYFTIMQYNWYKPFLYSEKQIINIIEGQDLYELKFKVGAYYDELLLLQIEGSVSPLLLDNCSREKNNIVCIVEKKELEEISYENNQKFELVSYVPNITQAIINSGVNYGIYLNYPVNKKNIFVCITKLTEKYINVNNPVVYETNVTDIDDVITKKFKLYFYQNIESYCYLKKTIESPLLLICSLDEGKFTIGKIANIIDLKDINIKYNFFIQPFENNEEIEISGKGTNISFVYPQVLNFTSNDFIFIDYLTTNNINFNNIRLNPNSKDLQCENHHTFIKKCIVTKDHFEKVGYHYTYHLNQFNNYIKNYELSPVNVILSAIPFNISIKHIDNKDTETFGQYGTIVFITNYNDYINNRLNNEIKFNSIIMDQYGDEYNVKCKFWKPLDENIRIFCNLEKNLRYYSKRIILKETSFDYNIYKINIKQDNYIEVEQYDYPVPFLYADKQAININDNAQLYYLKFNIESYNNDILYIHGHSNNYAILDQCKRNNLELVCGISKQKLEEILIYNDEIFKVGSMNDDVGLVSFDSILDITINYKNIIKEDIYLHITNSVRNESERDSTFGFNTNITIIPNFISAKFNKYYYLRKTSDKPLMLYVNYPEDAYDEFGSFTNITILNNIHYKYNFKILPSENHDKIKVIFNGTDVKLTYPEVLNYTKEETLIIRLIMSKPYFASFIKLNTDSSSYLNCTYLNEMLKCIVPLTHFDYKNSGYYNICHYNDYYIPYQDASPIKVIIPFETIVMNIEKKDNPDIINIGYNGIFYFVTNYNDNISNIFDANDIEENTSFNTLIKNDNAKCRLWKTINKNIFIFCKTEKIFRNGLNEISLKESTIRYKDYRIKIIPKVNYLTFKQLPGFIPFLYSHEQHIVIEEKKEIYEIIFKIGEYNNELLYLTGKGYGALLLDNYTIENNYIKFKVAKEDIEEITSYDGQRLYLHVFLSNNNSMTESELPLVYDIIINSKCGKKVIDIEIINIYRESLYIDLNNFISYETNVTNISNVYSSNFNISFTKKLINTEDIDGDCILRKTIERPLLLMCKLPELSPVYYIGEKKEKIVLNDISIKYDFIIHPFKNNESFITLGYGAYAKLVYPKVLNFYENDTLYIDYLMSRHKEREIYLNTNSSPLICNDYNFSEHYRCIVPKSHFLNKESGYFYTYHNNDVDEYLSYNELSPIKVILPKENEVVIRIIKEYNKNKIIIGNKGTFLFITNFDNTERYIFDEGFLKNESIKFDSYIIDEKQNKYDVKCKLWQPNQKNIRIICNLNTNLKYSKQNITLNQIKFNYNQYIIIINQNYYIEMEQTDLDLPFLYSDIQKIYIDPNSNYYNLKLKAESYNNDLLYIYGDKNNYQIIDNCELNKTELNCNLSRALIEKLVTVNDEQFKIGAINDNIGLIHLDNIENITIYFDYNVLNNKTNITFRITKHLTYESEVGVYYGCETDYNEDINLISDYVMVYNQKCQFRKVKGLPLLYLCLSPVEQQAFCYFNFSYTFKNLHFKYNLVILPNVLDGFISIKDYGTDIKLTYPEKLDFTNSETQIIRYIMTNPLLGKNIKLNEDSSDLVCQDLEGMKKCMVQSIHFINKKSGFYRTHHSNHENIPTIYYESAPINVILPEEKIIEIYVNNEDNKNEINIGKNGIIYFIANYDDKEKIFEIPGLEEKTEFKTIITDINMNNYDVTCRLWKPNDEKIRIFCKLSEGLKSETNNIKLNSVMFIFNNQKIGIISQMDYVLKVNQYTHIMPFIYSDKQIINIEKSKESYEIQLKALEYNNEQLIIFNQEQELKLNNILLNGCSIKGYNLLCKITKEKIEEILGYSGQIFELNYLDTNLGTLFNFNNVFNIIINYNSMQKENIYVGITSLIENYVDINTYVAYKTNITSISNIISNTFSINTNIKRKCLFKKSNDLPLLFLCKIESYGEFSLGIINSEIILDKINIKFNLLIQPVSNYEQYESSGFGSDILFAFPMVLDFYLGDSLIINYYINENEFISNIKLNPDSNEVLNCNIINKIKSCIVNLSHFEGKQSGYYYTYHKNFNYNKYSSFYELSPIQIILPNSEELIIKVTKKNNINTILLGPKGALLFITDFNDPHNIFEISDIEEKTIFNAEFDGYDKKYNSKCHLWKPKEENIRLICKFEENINSPNIILNKHTFEYKGKNIAIVFEDNLSIKQSSSNIAVLYSDKQEINVNKASDEYYLKFKKEIYNNEPLILSKDNKLIKNIYLNCKDEEKEVKCIIKKNKIIEKLSSKSEKYYLSQLIITEGILKLNDVLEITINYENVEKKLINLNIGKLLTSMVEKNNFIAYETNIEDIPIITTDYFFISPNKNDNMQCLFKKNSEEKDDKLLLLCKAESSGEGSLGSIIEQNLEDINVIYNFHIESTQNNEEYTVSTEEGTYILSAYPESLEFSSQENLKIIYQIEEPTKIVGIKLNNESSFELECTNGNGIKECIVPRNHFKESGYYYTYYNNSFGYKSISYEIPKIHITLKEKEESKGDTGDNLVGIIIGCIIGGLVLIGIIIFLVVRYYRRKNNEIDYFSSKEEKILPASGHVELAGAA